MAGRTRKFNPVLSEQDKATLEEELVNHINRWIMQVNAEPVIYRWKWKLEDIESAFA